MEYTLKLSGCDAAESAEAKSRIQELAKACREIMADNVITAAELRALKHWMDDAGWIRKHWPANILSARILNVLDPAQHAEKAAKQELAKILRELADGCMEEQDADYFDKEVKAVRYSHASEPRKFCFTGIFYFGTRAECFDAVRKRGGQPTETASGSLDYLIVGGVCSPRWVNCNGGTKIENALRARKKGNEFGRKSVKPKILRECDWVRLMPRVVEFEDGRAQGFAMYLPEAFKAAIEGYSFNPGDTIYDTPEADHEWAKALTKVNICVKVVSAHSGETAQLVYDLYRPNENRTELVRTATHNTTQEEFLEQLRIGNFAE
jgi:hypothetical protein